MIAYLVIFGILILIAIVSAVVNSIASKKDQNSSTTEISNICANGFGILAFFMFWFGLFCTC